MHVFEGLFRKVTRAYAHRDWRDAACCLTLETMHADSGKAYYPSDDKITAETLNSLCHDFSEALTEKMKNERVVALTEERWDSYLDEYRIGPTGSDLFKLAYWYGESLIQLLNESNHSPMIICAAKIHRYNILDAFVYQHTGKELNSDILLKLCITACRGSEAQNLGDYGAYLIFKTVSLQFEPVS